MQLPQFPSSAQISLMSVYRFGFLTSWDGGIPRYQYPGDVGIDFQVEFVENESATGSVVGVQLKSSESEKLLQTNGDSFHFSIEEKHKNYWAQYDLPVFIVLLDARTGVMYWQLFEPSALTGPKQQTIRIPKANVLGRSFLKAWRDKIQGMPKLARSAKEQKMVFVVEAATVDGNDRLRKVLNAIRNATDTLIAMREVTYLEQVELLLTQIGLFDSMVIREKLLHDLFIQHFEALGNLCSRKLSVTANIAEARFQEILGKRREVEAIAVRKVHVRDASEALLGIAADVLGEGLTATGKEIQNLALLIRKS